MEDVNKKKITIYLIVFFMIFIYISIFFVHNIVAKTLPTINTYEDNNDNNNDDNSNDDNSNEDNSNEDNNENEQTNNNNPNIIVNNEDRFIVLQGIQSWNEIKELDVFSNKYFEDKSIIAPGVSGTYNFTVENISEYKINYDMHFVEENIYDINMVYKLKLNGKYVVGDKNTWVKYNDLDLKDVTLNPQLNDVYTIEWKWQDNYNDTQIGETEGSDYKLKIQVIGSQE